MNNLKKPLAINVLFIVLSVLGHILDISNITLIIVMALFLLSSILVRWSILELAASLLIYIAIRWAICLIGIEHAFYMAKMCEAPSFTLISSVIFLIPLVFGTIFRKLFYKAH